MILIGADFRWENALYNYFNLDELIWFINTSPTYNETLQLKYSSASDYVNAIHSSKHLLSVEKDTDEDPDMYPYSDEQGKTFWTGFFTSRPGFKKEIIKMSRQYHASMQVYALQTLVSENDFELELSI